MHLFVFFFCRIVKLHVSFTLVGEYSQLVREHEILLSYSWWVRLCINNFDKLASIEISQGKAWDED